MHPFVFNTRFRVHPFVFNTRFRVHPFVFNTRFRVHPFVFNAYFCYHIITAMHIVSVRLIDIILSSYKFSYSVVSASYFQSFLTI